MEKLNLTREQRLEYLAKYISKYITKIISHFTNNKDYTEEIINNDTIMYLIKEYIDGEEANINNITVELNAPFETEYIDCVRHTEYNHVLYDLIIKDINI